MVEVITVLFVCVRRYQILARRQFDGVPALLGVSSKQIWRQDFSAVKRGREGYVPHWQWPSGGDGLDSVRGVKEMTS